ncbi:MAG: hypothetical protein AAFX58_10805 [Pseudomonadota bacterium]
MDNKLSTATSVRRQCGEIDGRMLAIIAGVLVIVVALAYFLLRGGPEPAPIPDPGSTRPLETVAPAETGAQRGDTARDIIDRLRADPGGPDYTEAYTKAAEFQAAGSLADAQLLYFFAARGGHAPAAFDLATFNDPNHFEQVDSLLEEPDAFQAYRWYTQARDAGHEPATERLAELRAWAETASGSGDTEADRLLLQWEDTQ